MTSRRSAVPRIQPPPSGAVDDRPPAPTIRRRGGLARLALRSFAAGTIPAASFATPARIGADPIPADVLATLDATARPSAAGLWLRGGPGGGA